MMITRRFLGCGLCVVACNCGGRSGDAADSDQSMGGRTSTVLQTGGSNSTGVAGAVIGSSGGVTQLPAIGGGTAAGGTPPTDPEHAGGAAGLTTGGAAAAANTGGAVAAAGGASLGGASTAMGGDSVAGSSGGTAVAVGSGGISMALGGGSSLAGAGGTSVTSGTGGTGAVAGGSAFGGVCQLGSVQTLGTLTVTEGRSSGDTGCSVSLPGKVERLTYDPVHERAYALDVSNRRISVVNMVTAEIASRDVVQVPNAACVDLLRSRLFVVNSGSSYVSEYLLSDLSLVRNIPWPAPSYDTSEAIHFHIYCGAERLYLVDGSWSPGLWTIENLDGCPIPVDHSNLVNSVGDLVLSSDESQLYYWYQYGWSAGSVSTSVTRVDTTDWSKRDTTNISYPGVFYRDPLDAPVLWDRGRKLIFSKNRVFHAENLSNVVFSFFDNNDSVFTGAVENVYALDAARGRFATRRNIYSADTFRSIAATSQPTANQYFFDTSGTLRMLVTATNRLECQELP